MGKKKGGGQSKNVYKCEICNGTEKNLPVVACDKCEKWYHFRCVGIVTIGRKDSWLCNNCKQPETPATTQQSIQTVVANRFDDLASSPQDPSTRSKNVTSPSQDLSPRSVSLTLPSNQPQKTSTKIIGNKSRHEYDLSYDENHPYYQQQGFIDNREHLKGQTPSSISSRITHVSSRRKQIELDLLDEERKLKEKSDRLYLEDKYRILIQNYSSDTERSYVSRGVYTKAWVTNQGHESYTPTQRPINEESIHRDIEALSIQETMKCEICHMVGHASSLRLCCTCNKTAHQTCMDPIKIDNENFCICQDCKIPAQKLVGDQDHRSSSTMLSTPRSTRIQYDTQKGQKDQKYCYVCHKFDDEKLFVGCVKCVKRCHHTCMDIIVIDNDDNWICPICKDNINQPKTSERETGRSSTIWPIKKEPPSDNLAQFKSSKPRVSGIPNNRIHCCEGCGKIDGTQPIVACDVCDKWYHFQCIKLATIDNRVMWICNTCKGPDVTSTNEKKILIDQQPTIPFEHLSRFVQDTNPLIQSSSIQQQQQASVVQDNTINPKILSSTQIASRHVVTRDLPIFAGKPEHWPMFLSRFKNSTELCGYSDSENLDRLQKCLKGNALEAVRSRLLTAESVPDIMNTLEMLYGRPELIVNSLMRKIRAEPPPKADKLNTLVDFALSVKNVCATLEQANLEYHLSNPALVQELVEKLPTNIKIEWAKHKENIPLITLSTLGSFLYNLARVISTVTEPSAPKDQKFENKPKRDYNYKEHGPVNSYSNRSDRGSENKDFLLVHTETKGKSELNKNTNQCKICHKKCSKVEICPTFLSYAIDQRWKEMYDKKLCRKCLGSHGRFCNQSKICGVNGCIFKHHSLLHDEKRHSEEAIKAKQLSLTSSSNNTHSSMLRKVLLRIVPITIHLPTRNIFTFAYQDEGSDITMIEENLFLETEIHGPLEPLCLLWTGEIQRKEEKSRRIKLTISGQNEFSNCYTLNDVRTVTSLSLPIQTVLRTELLLKFPYLEDTPFIDYVEAIPRILIGSDNASLNVPLSIIEGEMNQPIATKSRLGWSIYGPIDNRHSKVDINMNYHTMKCPCQHQLDEKIHQQVKDYFTLENFGIQVNSKLKLCSKEDEKALDMLKTYTKRIGNRFETALLWRYDKFTMPDSYGMTLKRLQCLEKYKPEKIGIINETIEDYIQKGYVSKLTSDDLKIKYSRVWYLPIFPVTYPKKPEKIRTVFDAAAMVKGTSLNSLLLKGPDQLASLLDILRRFREKRIAVTGDIKEMFHQVKIRDEDKQAQRFLWRNGDTTKDPDQYVMNVMTFGSTCSPSAAQFVKNLNASEFEEEHPRAVEAIVKNHYVDDLLDCEHSTEEAIQLLKDVKKIHEHGGFEIRNILSNSSDVRVEFNQNIGEHKIIDSKDSIGTERVLGMWWDTENDNFTFSLKFTKIEERIVNGERMPTKRELLKILMSIFDPLGLISHYLIHLKIILQDIWRSNMDWDDELSTEELQFAWTRWLDILPNVETIQIPRLYSTKMSPGTPNSIELHMFVDASEQAFSAVAYLRIEDDDGVECILIGSKAKVTPLKYLSIPRKELQAGILGTRLMTSIGNSQSIKINRRQIWTDSATLLSWIRSDHRKYHQFVAHRIGEILENTDLHEWRWVPSKLNVADEATKWTKTPSFTQTNRWFSGPEFLKLHKSEWPGDKVDIQPDTQEEMKVHHVHSQFIIPILINTDNMSTWNKLHRTVAYVIRYITILRKKVKKETMLNGPLTRGELISAENLIFRQAQYEGFTEEMVTLKCNQVIPKAQQKHLHRSSTLYTCSPYLDENDVMRIRGRIDLANNISYDTKRPIILPRNNKITRLLVANYHKEYHHRNHRTVYNQIRQKFFIPQLRVVLNSVRNNDCQKCKNRQAKPQPPEMADLPAARLAIGFRPFTFTGMDYFGPMYVIIGRRVEKRWGVIFTCMTIRAIHVEIAYTLNTDSCITCLRNFMNTRGRPEEIYSDQGTNMKGMDNELGKLVAEIDINRLATEFTTCYTTWHFNPPASPHMGGIYERMVRSVKTCLKDIMPARHMTEDTLRSLILEAVNIVNSRPLTYIPLEHEDDEILTPNHFLLGTSNGLKPPVEIVADGPILRSKWKENQRLTDVFWEKFVQEFLPDLTRRTKWYNQVEPIKVNDIVLMVDEKNIRNQYPKAIVLETVIGSNNQVRRAKVQRIECVGSRIHRSILWRPVHSLAKLDVHKTEVSLPVQPANSQTEGSVIIGNTGLNDSKNDNHDNVKF